MTRARRDRGDAPAPIRELAAATAGIAGPVAACHLPTLRANAADLRRRAGGTRIRVASKSVRCRGVLEEILGPRLRGDSGIAGVMAFSLAEALWLVGHGADDVLLGYPTVDRRALGELLAAEDARAAITLMIDSAEHLDLVASVAESRGLRTDGVRVCIDVDASLRVGPLHLGVRRSPLREPDEVAALAAIAIRRGFRVVGTMFYEAQVAGMPDSNPVVRLVKRASMRELAVRRGAVVRAVEAVVGRSLEIVNAGGSGSIAESAADDAVTEVTAGSGFYVPTLFDGYDAFEPHPAMFFGLDVVRRPAPGISTLFAGGYVASGPPGPSRVPKPIRRGVSLLGAEGAGEVQTPVTADLPLGAREWFRHAKAGELCERFSHVHLVDRDEHGETVGRAVPTYRGEGRCFG